MPQPSVVGRRSGRPTEIEHPAWPLQPAEAEFTVESMAAAHGLTLPDAASHLLFLRRLDVRARWPRFG